MTMSWSPRELRILEANAGKSASEVAAMLPGKSRSAVIAKRNRLRGVMFPSDWERVEDARERAAQREKLRQQQARKLRQMVAAEPDRNRVIQRARQLGIPLRMIGDVYGLTREWARVIALKGAAQ